MTIENDPGYIERRKWLEENRANYVHAQEIFNDPQAVRGLLNLIRLRTAEIFRYDPFTSPDTAAVALTVKMQENFKTLFADMEFIEEYEDRQAEQMAAIRAAEGLQPEGQEAPQTEEPG